MPQYPPHVGWLVKTGELLHASDGRDIEVWELAYQNDEHAMSAWARHFRSHYCCDADIDGARRGYGFSRAEYLERIKFPDARVAPGPSVRAGDFGEILVADYLEYLLRYWVPRTRYCDKSSRNESTRGCDTVGFKMDNWSQWTPQDELVVYESKSKFTPGDSSDNYLQNAVNDSGKDEVRLAESLNAVKRRLEHDGGGAVQVNAVERFQSIEDRPYRERYGAAAILDTSLTYSSDVLSRTDTTRHPKRQSLYLLVIRGNEMMALANDLYRRAADEA